MKILLIGSGGREHALAWRLAGSEKCEELYCAPGNPGMADMATCVDIPANKVEDLVDLAIQKSIDLVVVGPEEPLVLGLADKLAEKNIPVFGPKSNAAILEGSKAFMKDLCSKYNIPTASYGRFKDVVAAKEFIDTQSLPIVVKTDGLAAGKGVLICQSKEEAYQAVSDMLSGASFGAAGREVVIEEFLDGEELSFFALSDGKTVLPFGSAQDHKRVGDGDTGLNTGGMGAYSPAHLMTPDLQQKIMDRIVSPTVQGMAAEGRPYTGVLYAGIMVVKGEPYLIEYNVRFGDPECQVLMPRLGNDLLDILYAAAKGNLSALGSLQWSSKTALTVVIAAKGYPGAYEKGSVIRNINEAENYEGVKVFHAGTKRNGLGDLVSNGGRVLNVTAAGDNAGHAKRLAYEALSKIDWPDGFCRSDIGWRAVEAEKKSAA